MKRIILFTLLFLMGLPFMAKADWSETEYKSIEQNIRQPQFAEKEFYITKYGAKP